MTLEQKIEYMIIYGTAFIGTPYIWGGDDPIYGFDCSGFIQECLASVGFDPPGDQTAQGLFDVLSNKNYTEKSARGSILFFGRTRERITHVAIQLTDCLMLEAGGGDRNTIGRNEASAQNAFVRIRPIRKDLIAYLFPKE